MTTPSSFIPSVRSPSGRRLHPSPLRQAAGRVARQIEDAVAPYTTLDVEAAVVRLLGVTGTDESGVPLAQRFVGRLHRWNVLGLGGAHGLAGAMTRLRADAGASVARVLAGDLGPADLAIPVEVTPEVLKPILRGARRTLGAWQRARDDRLAILPVGPGHRLAEVLLDDVQCPYNIVDKRALDDEPALPDAAPAADLVVVVCPSGSYPAEETLRHARSVISQASERAGRYIRVGLRSSADSTAYLGALVALLGLDTFIIADFDSVAAQFARRTCNLAGVLVLGTGHAADDVGAELARALVAEQLAALAGLPPTGWGWIPGRPAHQDALASLFAPAFVAHTKDVEPVPFRVQNDILSYADALAHLEAWPSPALDPADLVKKAPGYWNPFA